MYKYDRRDFERKYSVDELSEFYLQGLKIESMFRGIKFKAPNIKHLKEGKEKQMKKIAEYYGKQ